MELNVQPEARKFILTTVAACVSVWGITFELGVWGEIFYGRLFNIWVVSLAVVLSIWFLPDKQAPLDWAGKLTVTFPTVWLILAFVNDRLFDYGPLELVLFWLGLLICLLCLPYLIYVLVSLLDTDSLSLKRRHFLAMIAIVIFVGMLGYIIGSNHHWFLTCQDFIIVGDNVPTNCVEG